MKLLATITLLWALSAGPTLCSAQEQAGTQGPPPAPARAQQATHSKPGQTWITHVTVINTETGAEAANRTVVLDGGRISKIRGSGAVRVTAGVTVVDGNGKYLIPGLWDMHAHGSQFDAVLPIYLANGITGIREMQGPPDANEFRAESAAKHLDAPHIYLGSPLVDGDPPMWPKSIVVKSAADGRRVVDDQKRRGSDFIKLYGGLSREAYFAILDESKRQGIPAEGHVPDVVNAWEASRAGQKSFEHLQAVPLACSARESELAPKILAATNDLEADPLFLDALIHRDEAKCQHLFDELRKNGTWQTPTLSVHRYFAWENDPQFKNDARLQYFTGTPRSLLTLRDDGRLTGWTEANFEVARSLFAAYEHFVGLMFSSGVPLLAGSDSMNPYVFPGFSLHTELAYMVEGGVTPLGALQAATRNPAIFMNQSDKYGSVNIGKVANLVLLDADPLQDIHNTTKIAAVFLSGKTYGRADLDRILKTARDNDSGPSY
jgi:hypothetical protein